MAASAARNVMYWKMLKKDTYSRGGTEILQHRLLPASITAGADPRPEPRELGDPRDPRFRARGPPEPSAHEVPVPRLGAGAVGAGPARGKPRARGAPPARHLHPCSIYGPEEKHRVAALLRAGAVPGAASAARLLTPAPRMPPRTSNPPAPPRAAPRQRSRRVHGIGIGVISRLQSPSHAMDDLTARAATASRPSRISAFGTPSSRATKLPPRAFARLCGPKSGNGCGTPPSG